MTVIWYSGIIICLFIVAGFAAMLGIGGGVFYTPLQVLFGVEIHEAAATSLFLIVILSFSATTIYRRAGKVDWKLALVLEAVTVMGSFSAGYLSNLIPQKPLTIILVATLILAGVIMLRGDSKSHEHRAEKKKFYLWRRTHLDHAYHVNMLVAFPVSLTAGALSGLLGIGGGIIKVPMMVLLLGIPMDIAIATSAFMIGITAAGGFAGHVVVEHWNWKMSLILAPAVFIGAWTGAHMMLKTKKDLLKKAFGILALLIALSLAIRVMV